MYLISFQKILELKLERFQREVMRIKGKFNLLGALGICYHTGPSVLHSLQ